MNTARSAIAWAAAGSLIGVVVWATLAATFSFPAAWEWPLVFLGSAYWAAFIGAAAFPAYTLLLGVWLMTKTRREPLRWGAEATVAALLLGSPLAALITLSSASASSTDLFWAEAWRTAGLAFPTCWLAILLPPRILPTLRARLEETVA
jgi:hypothetical protein